MRTGLWGAGPGAGRAARASPTLRSEPTPPHAALRPGSRARRCSSAPQPLPPSDAPLKSYLSSCSLFPPCPGLICLLPPTHPPPASHLCPPPRRSPRPLATASSRPVPSCPAPAPALPHSSRWGAQGCGLGLCPRRARGPRPQTHPFLPSPGGAGCSPKAGPDPVLRPLRSPGHPSSNVRPGCRAPPPG